MENSLITYHLALSNCATTNVQSQLGLLSLKKELEYEHLGYILELLNKCKNSLDSLCFTNHQWFTFTKIYQVLQLGLYQVNLHPLSIFSSISQELSDGVQMVLLKKLNWDNSYSNYV